MSEDKWKYPQSLLDTRYLYKKTPLCCTKAVKKVLEEIKLKYAGFRDGPRMSLMEIIDEQIKKLEDK